MEQIPKYSFYRIEPVVIEFVFSFLIQIQILEKRNYFIFIVKFSQRNQQIPAATRAAVCLCSTIIKVPRHQNHANWNKQENSTHLNQPQNLLYTVRLFFLLSSALFHLSIVDHSFYRFCIETFGFETSKSFLLFRYKIYSRSKWKTKN